jgi:ABC-type transport system involved in multi-copper enzyme maturation permease subunit
MLREIILRELLDHLRSLRFSLTFLLSVILMLTGSVLYVHDYRQQVADYSENVNENLRLLREKAKKGLYEVVSFPPNQIIYRSPNPLGFIAGGGEKDLPNAFEVDAFELKGPMMKLRGNYTLWRFEGLDWVFIVGVILSFAALVLTYDGISGERERGTLRLSLSNPLPRSTLLLGKYIGATVTLAIPLIVGICTSALIVSLLGVSKIGMTNWMRIGLITFISTLYISVFTMLGLFISGLTRSSRVSLVFSLLAWVCLVVLIPRTGGLLASGLIELPDERIVSGRAWEATMEVVRRYGRGGFSWNWSPGEPLSHSVKVADAQLAIWEDYRNRQLNQVKLARSLTSISPAVIYRNACERLIGTGIGHYERFLKEAKEYRRALLQFTYEKYRFSPDVFLRGEELGKLSEIKISFDEVPKFRDKPPDIPASFADASWDILLLFLFNVVLFIGATLAFIRYRI